MFILEKSSEKVGKYLNGLILEKYQKVRRFCIAYIKLSGLDENDNSVIAKMQNRMSPPQASFYGLYIPEIFKMAELGGVSIVKGGNMYTESGNLHCENVEAFFFRYSVGVRW